MTLVDIDSLIPVNRQRIKNIFDAYHIFFPSWSSMYVLLHSILRHWKFQTNFTAKLRAFDFLTFST